MGAGIVNRILSNVLRARVSRVDDSGDVQRVQIHEHGVPLDVDHLLPFGFACHPPKESRGIVASVGGSFEHLVALCLSLARHRPRDLAEGDATVYDAHGHRIDLDADGVAVNCDTTVDGAVDATGYKCGVGFTGVSGVVSIPTPGGTALLQFKGGILTQVAGTATLTPLVGG